MSRRVIACCLVLALVAAPATRALETDPYEAWTHEIADGTDALNAKINYELQKVIERVNGRRGIRRLTCDTVADHVTAHFRMLIFHPIEIWASKSPLIDRYPPTEEAELQSRETNIFGNHGPWDIGTWLPFGPTIEIHGVRIGTDKLAHFFSGGSSYYALYRRAQRQGKSAAEAERTVIDRGIFSEQTYLGYGTSGVMSPADLEANYRGMTFYLGLCNGDSPQLERDGDGYRLARSFDAREYVTVDWDESYNNSGFNKRRWKKVRPRLLGLCALLDHPWVVAQRRRYRERDTETPTELRMRQLIDEGKQEDLSVYSLDATCEGAGP
ncbi:MAG: hypothetical protein GTN89_05500 [Acidobacteria bacterium]|nr:hypothetical protein [Acidobacteriota bacterium]NIM61315.1 hypothetical protein [Acidobacteriota bacterium]NIO58779.1 hypothetical protein [Acidobacteriota bacterium]NIQ29822.1 hypothetical protein [Acidobacteriota bacterium]NIQ84545.1 hypothetical protein [Acidobacteriota bacterium]